MIYKLGNYRDMESLASLDNAASQFSRKLRREYRVLYEEGYTVNFDNTGADGSHIEILRNK